MVLPICASALDEGGRGSFGWALLAGDTPLECGGLSVSLSSSLEPSEPMKLVPLGDLGGDMAPQTIKERNRARVRTAAPETQEARRASKRRYPRTTIGYPGDCTAR